MRRGLTLRLAVVSGLLAVIVGGAFFVLLTAIQDQRDAGRRAVDARRELAASNGLEKLVIDIETGVRGFIITREQRFLEPWTAARTAFPKQARAFVGLVGDAEQQRLARQITRAGTAYIRGYSLRIVNAVRRNAPSARSVAVTAEGKRHVDALRAQFDRFAAREREILNARQEKVDSDSARAIVVGALGLAGSVALSVLLATYLMRAVGRPIRRTATMADRLAQGDLAVRMPETGTGEIGDLEHSFNVMAGSLEKSRDELLASRARIVTAADEARRRIQRDLHDGAQQRLVHAVITLRMARRALQDGGDQAQALVGEALDHAERATSELRELSHGLLPSVLTRGGLQAGVEALTSRISLPVTADVTGQRLPPAIEAAAYFVVSEALTNAAKHSQADRAFVKAEVTGGELRVEVSDDGVGGAAVEHGTGLLGLHDRVAAFGGRLGVESPRGGGTRIVAALPLSDQAASEARADGA